MRLWERQYGETDKAFAAFCAYRDMGYQRSIKGASGKASAPRAWREWSINFSWVARAAAYDEHLAAVAVVAAEDNVKVLASAYRKRVLAEAAEMADVGRKMVREAEGMEDRVGASIVTQRGVSIWEKARQIEGMAIGITTGG